MLQIYRVRGFSISTEHVGHQVLKIEWEKYRRCGLDPGVDSLSLLTLQNRIGDRLCGFWLQKRRRERY
jgi:hypothetical protein